MLECYRRTAPRLLPHLRDRPATLESLPEGLDGPDAPHFWQKRTPNYDPAWIERVALPSERGEAVDALPDRATVERSKVKGGRRVYIDVMQSAQGHHAVPP